MGKYACGRLFSEGNRIVGADWLCYDEGKDFDRFMDTPSDLISKEKISAKESLSIH